MAKPHKTAGGKTKRANTGGRGANGRSTKRSGANGTGANGTGANGSGANGSSANGTGPAANGGGRDWPHATMIVTCYNQEKYIQPAIESVLAQTYTPLDILISDDCSTDRTYELIREITDAYDGPHTVVVNRNETNVSPGHLREVWPMVKGEIAVLGHGDDIQHPDRVKATVERMLEENVSVVTCNATVIDAAGKPTRYFMDPNQRPDLSLEAFGTHSHNSTVFGAGMAWHREVFDVFGPVYPGPRNTDNTIGFRGALLRGGSVILDPKYVQWRVHDNNRTLALKRDRMTDSVDKEKVTEQMFYNKVANLYSYLYDLQRYTAARAPSQDPRRPRLNALQRKITENLITLTGGWVEQRLKMTKAKILPD
jgi:glycosyltransferase involved in cell wall biosynthesis